MRYFRTAVLTAPMISVAGIAMAHPGSATAGLGAGLAHPLTGMDHVLAMLAVGLWAAQRGGPAAWALPAGFLLAMAAGGGLGMAGWPGIAIEPLILASVICLGAAVMLALQAPMRVAVPVVMLFGAAHGVAHGTEGGGAGTLYGLGFLASTAVLHGAGLGLGLAARRMGSDQLPRLLGGMTALGGVALAIG